MEGLGTSPWGQRRHAQLGSRSESTTSPTALITSLDRAAPSRPIIPDAMSISRFSKARIASQQCHTIARHAELTRLERHAIRRLGPDHESPRRTENHHNTVSLVQAFPRDDDDGAMSGRQVDRIDLTWFHQEGFSSIQEAAARRPGRDKTAFSRISSSVSWGPLPHIPPERPEPRRHPLRALEQTHGWDARASKRWLVRRSTRSRSAPSRFLIPAGGRLFRH